MKTVIQLQLGRVKPKRRSSNAKSRRTSNASVSSTKPEEEAPANVPIQAELITRERKDIISPFWYGLRRAIKSSNFVENLGYEEDKQLKKVIRKESPRLTESSRGPGYLHAQNSTRSRGRIRIPSWTTRGERDKSAAGPCTKDTKSCQARRLPTGENNPAHKFYAPSSWSSWSGICFRLDGAVGLAGLIWTRVTMLYKRAVPSFVKNVVVPFRANAHLVTARTSAPKFRLVLRVHLTRKTCRVHPSRSALASHFALRAAVSLRCTRSSKDTLPFVRKPRTLNPRAELNSNAHVGRGLESTNAHREHPHL
eukprot:1178476-Prorocentrum_minimum.AAC.2